MKWMEDRPSKVSFTSLGCPRNLVDTEVMLGIMLKAGFEVTQYIEEADFLVVNTCGFLEASRTESKDTIRELLREKKEGAKVIVTGCMVSKHKGEIEDLFPEVHFLLGSGDVEGILEAVRSDTKGQILGSAKSYLESGEIPRKISTPQHYAYLKISEGCRKGCAYCIIPKIKGPLRSKTEEQIIKEFSVLLKQGVQEIILIAQDLGDYGKDFGYKDGKLSVLLNQMLNIPGNYWLRLLYLYPDEITDDLIDLMAKEPRLCPYLDMPIQHINDEILKQMRRHTSSEQIKNTIVKLRTKIPDVKIRTSLIVGFPGETEEHFEELVTFLKEYPLDHVGIFKYSREEGSHAATLPDQIDDKVKEKRYKKLMKTQQKSLDILNEKMIGKKIEVVVEGYHPESPLLMVGRYWGQCPDIDGIVILNEFSSVKEFGKRVLVEITGAAGYDLVGKVVSSHRTTSKSKSLSIV